LIYIKSFILTFMFIFTVSCSDSKPDKLINSFSNDLNGTTLATNRVSQIRVYANYDNATQEEITDTLVWSSSNESIATVTAGLVQTYLLVGDVDIKYATSTTDSEGNALYENRVSFNVKELTLTDITLSKNSISLGIGAKESITARGTFIDDISLESSTQDITEDGNWSTLDAGVCSVDLGVVKAIAEGNTTVSIEDSNIVASLAVEVTKTNYTSLSVYSSTTAFNVKQTIELQARATTDDNRVVILDNDEVTWSSSDPSVTMSENIATAISNGTAAISAKLVADSAISNSIVLSVDKEEYVRLFSDDVELSLPYVSIESNSSLGETLGTFTLIAVGADFEVSNLFVSDFNDNEKGSGEAYFDSLSNGEILSVDNNITFYLKQDTTQTQLHFSFDINDSTRNNSFSQKYEEIN